MAGDNGEDRREAAACVERGIERYSEGQYQAAQQELEAALALHPGHPRAVECLSWVREIAAGRRSPSSDSYQAILDEDTPKPQRAVLTQVNVAPTPNMPTGRTVLGISPVEIIGPYVPPPQPQRQASNPALRAIVQLPVPKTRVSGTNIPSLPGVTLPPEPVEPGVHAAEDEEVTPIPAPLPAGRGQLEESPDSVTREWSSIATASLPQLDVPELSEEQIANLLDLDRGQGFTLSAGKMDHSERPSADDDDDEESEHDRTNVRSSEAPRTDSGEYEVEVIAGSTDDDDVPAPSLTPLAAAPPLAPRPRASSTGILRTDSPSQTADDAPSLPTNPFGHQRIATLLAPASPAALEAAMLRGERREIVEIAEALAGRDDGADQALLTRAYELVVGNFDAIPRYGKASSDLDSRSAFLLSRMDGSMSLDDLLDISGMPRADALRVLARLIVAGVVVTQR